ncbi:MAG: type II toxin-antitoxin system VapB family antitoxin [Euzebya sp.]
MVLSIKSERVDRLARELAALTGESITDAVEASLVARLELQRRRTGAVGLGDIIERFGALTVVDDRDGDDILGYNDVGLPT